MASEPLALNVPHAQVLPYKLPLHELDASCLEWQFFLEHVYSLLFSYFKFFNVHSKFENISL